MSRTIRVGAILAACLTISLHAQDRAGAFSNLTVTSSTSNDSCIGCVVGTTTATGTEWVGTVNVATLATLGSLSVPVGATTLTTLSTSGLATLNSLTVTGASNVATLAASGASTFATTVGVTGNTTIGGTLAVTGAITAGSLLAGVVVDKPISTAVTGPQDNFAPGLVGNTVLLCTNASLLGINGFSGGVDGQHVIVIASGAGTVEFLHEATSTTAANRLTNLSAAILPGASAYMTLAANAGGSAEFVYSATLSRWRMISFEQGGWISFAPIWTSTGTGPAIGNGTASGAFWQKGHTMNLRAIVTFGSTSTFGSGVYLFALPALPTAGGACPVVLNTTSGSWSAVAVLTAGTANTAIYESHSGASTGIGPTTPATWASGNSLIIQCSYETL